MPIKSPTIAAMELLRRVPRLRKGNDEATHPERSQPPSLWQRIWQKWKRR